MSGRAAIFMDRDGTVNEPVGFVNHISLFRLFPWSVEAIRLVNRAGFLAVLVTNQSGVARGLYTEELVGEVHGRLNDLLDEGGAHLDAIYYCPHGLTSGCDCRKPKPGMLLRAERELEVDLARSYVIGDTYSDLELAWNTGARAALVLTGYGRGNFEHHRHEWARQPDKVVTNLYDAVAEIVREAGK